MFGFHTITDGQCVALWDIKAGTREIVRGPKRLWLRGRRVQALQSLVAGPTQYLVVQHRDGRVVHQRGPAIFWIDPVEHLSVHVQNAIPLDANEALVVYRQQSEGKVERRIVRGPELFVPEASEWLHEFRWHGSDPANPKRKVPRGACFTKLRVIPDQMYFDVEGVRTADDALIVVKLMIFFELIDIAVMLDQTHDVTADFINAVTADVIDFAAGRTFEQFKEHTDQLNARETYPQLAQRAGRIGYRINKVVYRGYEATPKLQSMHDGAIETRTRLKLDAETESQQQALADLKLARERQRAEQRQQMERAEAEHKTGLDRQAHDELMRQRQVETEQAFDAEERKTLVDVERKAKLYEQRVGYLRTMRELQVDMTRYLVARHERPDRRIEIGGNGCDRRTLLHLHEG